MLLIVLLLCQVNEFKEKPYRVLFIGNSYTYMNQMPELFRDRATAAGFNVKVDWVTSGGMTLSQHASSSKTQQKLSQGFDFVVLQEQSLMPLQDLEKTLDSVQTLAKEIRRKGGEPLLMMTWGRQKGWGPFSDFKGMNEKLIERYQHLAKKLNLRVIPVAQVWQFLVERDPNIELWKTDGSHPSRIGSEVIADILVKYVFEPELFSVEHMSEFILETTP